MSTTNHSISVSFKDGIGIINFGEGEKRLSFDFMIRYNKALDEIERNTNCKALISTGTGKFFCNGIDLDYLKNGGDREHYFYQTQKLFCRILTFPIPTMAAINGHCFAGGLFLAWCHDYRSMRTERGWVSLNEVFIDLRLNKFFLQLFLHKTPRGQVQNELLVYGKRFTAQEALKYGIVDLISDQSQLLDKSLHWMLDIVTKNNYKRQSFQNMKSDLYNEILKTALMRELDSKL